jgi:hypothetical protein
MCLPLIPALVSCVSNDEKLIPHPMSLCPCDSASPPFVCPQPAPQIGSSGLAISDLVTINLLVLQISVVSWHTLR